MSAGMFVGKENAREDKKDSGRPQQTYTSSTLAEDVENTP
jgi:hypothetical protein